MNKSFYLESLGCAKNQVESEHLIAVLEARGLSPALEAESADYLIVNTCGFIASAKKESIDTVLDFRRLYPDKKIVLVGCLALRYQADLEQELGEADGIWGDIHHPGFPDFVAGLLDPATRPATATAVSPKAASTPDAFEETDRQRLLSFPGSVYIKIAEGCANRCTYCAIPLIRGGLRSRRRADIVSEAKAFLDRGIRELILIAQDTSSFGLDRGQGELAALLAETAALPGDFWVRLLYLHPDRFSNSILDALASSPKILPYFDLPFQHASTRILTAMNRRGNADTYLALVASIRQRLPEAVIRTTFLTGFPGESDEDFAELVKFQARLRPAWAGVFAYSPEEDTQAFALKPKVPKKTALARKAEVEERQTKITATWLDGLAGLETEVLIEEKVEGEGLLLGRAWFQAPEVDGLVVVTDGTGVDARPGDRIRVHIDGRAGVDLRGTRLP
jgi:ribosomal protein S12 methylthiotransferase